MQTVDVIRCIGILLAYELVPCWSCNDGFFRDESKGCVKCPDNCQFCESNEYCLSCKNGYWGNACEQSCSACKADTSCDKTNGVCVESCKDGYTGVLCDSRCSERCSSCNRTNAQICLCCAHGWYPPVSCNKSCPVSCNNSSCSAKDLCTNGCDNGFYGQLCELRCSWNCRENLCYQDNGTCVHGCEGKFTGTKCDSAKETGSTATVVAVVLVVLVLLIGAVIAGFILRMRMRRPPSNTRELKEAGKELIEERDPEGGSSSGKKESDNLLKENQLDTADSPETKAAGRTSTLNRLCWCFKAPSNSRTNMEVQHKSEPRETNSTDLEPKSTEQKKKTKDEKLGELVKMLNDKTNKDNEMELKTEFEKIPSGGSKPSSRSMTEENQTKVEKQGIFPYDENRVVVRGDNNKELYVNASFIKDNAGEKHAYIASRGPRKKGSRLMWMLLQQNNCKTVVMLNEIEEGKKKKYWPKYKSTASHGKLSVHCTNKDNKGLQNERCIIREFELKKEKKITPDSIKHLQYTGWSEGGVPESEENLLHFIERVRKEHGGSGPLLVHGRRGVGRTGTFIALDMLLKDVNELLESDKEQLPNIASCVTRLREQRVQMVENIEQYTFLYKALLFHAEKKLHEIQTTTDGSVGALKREDINAKQPTTSD